MFNIRQTVNKYNSDNGKQYMLILINDDKY